MKVLLAVIEDLFLFATSWLVSKKKGTKDEAVEQTASISEIDEDIYDAMAHEEEVLPGESMPVTFRSAAEIIDTVVAERNTVMYVGSVDVPLFFSPTLIFDGVLMKIPYGTMVMFLENQGRWAHVMYRETKGWLLREDLVDRAAHVYPHFVIGERNEADDPNTIRLRAMIGDEYSCGIAKLPLQSPEYGHYKLQRKGLRLPWSDVRPRIVGTWHTILKGSTGVHVGVHPKTGTLMEYTLENDEGRIAYVEAVFPDETINISEVNYPEGGIYNERVLAREEWRELRPLFIQVT